MATAPALLSDKAGELGVERLIVGVSSLSEKSSASSFSPVSSNLLWRFSSI